MACVSSLNLPTLILSFSVLITYTSNFNIDTNLPVLKVRDAGSYFGFSVEQHQVYDVNGRIQENLFLVGAPKEGHTVLNISDKSEKMQYVPGFGGVYKCRLTTETDDCELLKIGSDDSKFGFKFQGKRDKENATDQWLGGLLSREPVRMNNVIMACAHRFKKLAQAGNDMPNWGIGRCYLLGNDLTLYQDGYAKYEPCSTRRKTHQNYGYCLSGTGAAIGKDGLPLIGAPGAKNYRGEIFKFKDDQSWDYSDDVTETGSNMGYSATSGNYSGVLEFVTGAPRSPSSKGINRSFGDVFIFGYESNNFQVRHRLGGFEVGSYFGSSLCSADVNNDGYDDLLVGAPFYYQRNKYIGGAVYIYHGGKQGINEDTKPALVLHSRKMEQRECDKLGCINSQFGHTISAIGDVNQDNYNDIAISAPYEGDGAVYIYHGSKSGLLPEYSQRITPSQLGIQEKLKTFGSSIAGGLDLDDNGYPDIVVGSYQSAAVVLLRSRPIIKLFANVSISPSQINPLETKSCQFDNDPRLCFKMSLCLHFKTHHPQKRRFHSGVSIKYRIEGFIYPGAVSSRIEFKRSITQDKNVVESDVKINNEGLPFQNCTSEIAYLKKKFSDRQRPLKFAFKFSLDEESLPNVQPLDPLPHINKWPILDSKDIIQQAKAGVYDVTFITDCNGKICQTDLDLKIVVLLPTAEDTGLPILGIGEHSRIDLNVTITNNKEAAHETKFFIKLPKFVTFTSVESEQGAQPVTCSPVAVENSTVVSCPDIGNPLKSQASRRFVIHIVPIKLYELSGKKLLLESWVNTTSKDVNKANNFEATIVEVITRADLIVQGSSAPEQLLYSNKDIVGESAIKRLSEIGQEVNHTYTVRNAGPGVIPSSTLNIFWPYELGESNQGKHLLYLIDVPKMKPEIGQCYMDNPDAIDPAKIKDRSRDVVYTRKRREVEKVKDEDAVEYSAKPADDGEEKSILKAGPSIFQTKLKNAVDLHCNSQKVRCVKIRCEVEQEMGPNDVVKVTVNSRLWQNTLLQEYRDVEGVKIWSHASIQIEPDLKIVQDPKHDSAETFLSAFPDIGVVSEVQGVKWWVILIAVVCGVILLVLLILLFWKCGFFKRKKMMYVNNKAASEEQVIKSENEQDVNNDDHKQDMITGEHEQEVITGEHEEEVINGGYESDEQILRKGDDQGQ